MSTYFDEATNLQTAITGWALNKVSAERPLTLIVVDHGVYDRFYLDKPNAQTATPGQIDDWLSQIEAARPGLKVNVFIEACQSGSFIDQPQEISKPGRVVIASTGAYNLAWASANGALFSDYFISTLRQGESLYSGFQIARSAVQMGYPDQTPWLDDNGNTLPNDATDGVEAQRRGFNVAGGLGHDQWSPFIVDATGPITLTAQRGEVQATVLDDEQVARVWAVVYPPSYQAPVASEALVTEKPPTFDFVHQGNSRYSATYAGFTESGAYRLVVHARDDDGFQAQPVVISIQVNSPPGARESVFLPVIQR